MGTSIFTNGRFSGKYRSLAGDAPVITTDFSVISQNPVARDQVGDRVMANSGTYRSMSPRVTNGIGQRTV